MKILSISASASILIIIITTIRALALNYLPKKMFLYLWDIVLLRLLVSFYLPLFNIKPIGLMLNAILMNHTQTFSDTLGIFLKYIWIIGALCIFSTIVFSHIKACQEYHLAIPLDNIYIKQWLMDHPLKRQIQVKTFDKITSAMTYGIIRPIIILPASLNFKDDKTLNFILTHEYIHIKRFDLIIKWLLVIALSIHWFNPTVWLMYVFASRDIELSCDEKVIQLFGEDQNAVYSRILLGNETYRLGFISLINYMGKTALEERIISLMKAKNHTKFTLIIAISLVILLLFVGFTTLSHKNRTWSDLNNSQNIIIHDESEIDSPSYVVEQSLPNSSNSDENYELSAVE